jgi:hypothetical protein
VNSLQLISYMPLMKIQLPQNLFYVLSLINGPMQFNLIDTDGMTKAIFDISMDSNNLTYSKEFSNFGFNSNLALLNLNSTLYYLMLFPIFWLIN